MATVHEIKSESWDMEIRPQASLLEINFKEIWSYRDLLVLLVRRDFVATYKQTILGPIWFFLQPILTTLTFLIVFGRIAKLPTGEVPAIPFYLAGITLWNYFAESLTRTSTVFKDNANIFGKVYFPRLIMPLSIVVSNLVKLGIQFGLFLLFWVYYLIFSEHVHPNLYILLTPLLVVMLGILGLGFGMIISAMTTKYRDLALLLSFSIQLLMYGTPVVYSLAGIKPEYKWIKLLVMANPMSEVIETFRLGFLGEGTFTWGWLGYSAGFTLLVLVIGTIVFNRVEKSFMDTV